MSFDPDLKGNPLAESTFDLLRAGATLITATPRLSREVAQAYNQSQLQDGQTSWNTPDVLPYSSWIERTWRAMRSSSDSQTTAPDVVLSPSQSRQLWKNIIQQDIRAHGGNTEPLWNINATVRSAMEAWRICQQWHIDCNDFDDFCLTDHLSFARWGREYQSHCRERRWLDSYQLPAQLTAQIKPGMQADWPHLIWAGFDNLSPEQERLIERMRSAGIRVSRLQPDAQPAAQQEFMEFETGRDQWLAAAQWAKRRLASDPQQRIAIVAPELAQSRQDIELEFTRTLCPTHLINPDKYYDRPFHIALGRQLATYPVVRSAINLLNLFTEKPIRFEAIACMLIDPWIRGAARDRAQRHRLEYRYRQQFAHETTIHDAWTRIIQDTTHPDSDETTPELTAIFSRIKPLLIGQGERKTCSEWAEIFTQWLDGFGWPGDETLGSAEHQTVQAFRKEILNLATLDLIKQRTTLGEALSILTERLKTQPFEPESAKVNIEIMGILESSGIQFDAVWFGNLTEKEWPPRLNKNPFIPASMQTKAGYFKADFKLNQDYAGKLQEQLTGQCREIVFSRIQLEEGVEQPPSPLIQWPDQLSAATNPPELSLLEHYQQHKPMLEVFDDYNGVPVTEPYVRGGTAVIEDHSACPFRSYAIHRLNARENEYRQPGLDAMGRGILIHHILEKIWRQVKTLKELRTMMRATEPDPLIMEAINDCSQPVFSQGGLDRGFSEIQTDWLVSLIRQWFEEAEMWRHQDFQVIEMEKKYSLELGGLKLLIKVDRMDRLADGSRVLIDYKTGATGTFSSWVGARPQRPQLPLYALAVIQNSGNNDSIECMAYGQVRHADCIYRGISINQEFHLDTKENKPKVVPLEKARVGHRPLSLDWKELLTYWENVLGKLAQSFAKGHAEVNPRDLKVCGNCNLLSLCRRHELADNPADDTEPAA